MLISTKITFLVLRLLFSRLSASLWISRSLRIASYTPRASAEEKISSRNRGSSASFRVEPAVTSSADRLGGIAIYGTAPPLSSFKLGTNSKDQRARAHSPRPNFSRAEDARSRYNSAFLARQPSKSNNSSGNIGSRGSWPTVVSSACRERGRHAARWIAAREVLRRMRWRMAVATPHAMTRAFASDDKGNLVKRHRRHTPCIRRCNKLAGTVRQNHRRATTRIRDPRIGKTARRVFPPFISLFSFTRLDPAQLRLACCFRPRFFPPFCAPTSGSLSPWNVAACVYLCVSH